MLERLELTGFKSIQKMDLPLRSMNVMIGANGAGKSNLISFFNLIRHLATRQLELYVAKRGLDSLLFGGVKITQEIDASLHFKTYDDVSTSYNFNLGRALSGGLVFQKEVAIRSISGVIEPEILDFGRGGIEANFLNSDAPIDVFEAEPPFADQVRRHLLSCPVFHIHDTSDTSRVMQPGNIDDNQQLKGDFGNLAAFLYALEITKPEIYRQIVRQVQQVAPFFLDFDLQPQKLNNKNITLNWKQRGSDVLCEPWQLSDGTLRMIAMTALLLQPKDNLPEVIILDEPELGLHPFAISLLAGMLRMVSQHTQIIVATQSPLLVNEFDPEDVIVVDRSPSESKIGPGESIFRRLQKNNLEEWLKEYSLGELWQKNVLGGRPSHE